MVPFQTRAAEFAFRNVSSHWLHQNSSNRVFTLPAAVGDEEGSANFNVALGPACGSLLRTSKHNSFWCAETETKQQVIVITLKNLIDLIPSHETIAFIHLKVDCLAWSERRHQATVIIEYIESAEQGLTCDGECLFSDAKACMCRQGFCIDNVEGQGGQINIMFRHSKNATISEFLSDDILQFQTFYMNASIKSRSK